MSYSLSNKSFGKQKKDDKPETDAPDDVGITDTDMRDNERSGDNKTGNKIKKTRLYYAKMPWNLSMSYTLQYNNAQRQNEISSNSLMFNGDIELSPKWNVGFNSSYDFRGKGMGDTRLNFQRDLDSWKMRFSWSPFGNYKTYYFFIGVKSAVLGDLKYDKRKLPDKRLF